MRTGAAAATAPRIAVAVFAVMLTVLLEALGALVALLFIVWWTMFAGRQRGERKRRTPPHH